MQRITTQERLTRLARRHRLAPSTWSGDPAEAARSLVGYHGTDPASVYLQARARTADLTQTGLQRALYEARSLVRLIGMRRTLFVVPTELLPVVHAAASRAIAARERGRLVAMVREAAIAVEPTTWLESVEAATMAALAAHEEPVAAATLSAEVVGLRERVAVGSGRWAGSMSVATRLLMVLAMEGRIVRAPPRGTWISGQYRWAPAARWLGGDLLQLPTDAAQADLIERWLRGFGPGTERDLAWWTGLPLGAVRRALARLATAEVTLDDGTTGLVLEADREPDPPTEPWIALLPALDATVMGWQARDWYLGPHSPALFDTSGNAGPTVWAGGRIVGGWSQRQDGTVVVRLLEDPGRDARLAIDAEAAALAAWIGHIRVVPRFRTPLEAELVAAG
ncbi:MAG TPA: winged helix DNA-binding domain-containing protein [Candidatus Sulfotelmatobacter sp.]|nr:winged helix DNA-binding domain-containing protein [Candidatus Sulfotelmatobacter sp.]